MGEVDSHVDWVAELYAAVEGAAGLSPGTLLTKEGVANVMRIRAHSVSSSNYSRGEPGRIVRAQADRKLVRTRRERNAKGKETHVPGGHTASGFGAPLPEQKPGAAIKLCGGCGEKKAKIGKPCKCKCPDCGVIGHASKRQYTLCSAAKPRAAKPSKDLPTLVTAAPAPRKPTYHGLYAGW